MVHLSSSFHHPRMVPVLPIVGGNINGYFCFVVLVAVWQSEGEIGTLKNKFK
jgi:hypothetical protein